MKANGPKIAAGIAALLGIAVLVINCAMTTEPQKEEKKTEVVETVKEEEPLI